jgi:LCP family protein required for cell wall assembly
VDIPGHGPNKINAAHQLGGPALAIDTVKALTGLRVNHVMLVDFQDFREVIDAVGGIEVDVPNRIISNNFDCPYDEARCREWQGWRFDKGRQKMDGKRALIYSRIRENRLDPDENDLTRGGRQQEVVEALTDKLVGPSTFVRLPFIGDKLMTPLTTDLSANQLLQLGWVKFRANSSRALHCRLGGEPQLIDGQEVLIATEENTAAISMFTGRSAAQPPPPGAIYAAGCVIGSGRSG